MGCHTTYDIAFTMFVLFRLVLGVVPGIDRCVAFGLAPTYISLWTFIFVWFTI